MEDFICSPEFNSKYIKRIDVILNEDFWIMPYFEVHLINGKSTKVWIDEPKYIHENNYYLLSDVESLELELILFSDDLLYMIPDGIKDLFKIENSYQALLYMFIDTYRPIMNEKMEDSKNGYYPCPKYSKLPKLKECPICDRDVKLVYKSPTDIRIVCNECQLEMKAADVYPRWHTSTELIDRWNNRKSLLYD